MPLCTTSPKRGAPVAGDTGTRLRRTSKKAAKGLYIHIDMFMYIRIYSYHMCIYVFVHIYVRDMAVEASCPGLTCSCWGV